MKLDQQRLSQTIGNATERSAVMAPVKPPSVLVFTGDSNQLFERIKDSLLRNLPADSHVIFHVSLKAMCEDPWIDESQASCLMIADTKSLDDSAWLKLQDYFRQGGKMLFVCQNSLLMNLTGSEMTKMRTNVLKIAFGDQQTTAALSDDFEQFLKRVSKSLMNMDSNESFHVKDLVGINHCSMVASGKSGAPLLLFVQNTSLQASALFSDATTDLLLADEKLISEALGRLGFTTVGSPRPGADVQPSPAYLIQSPDSPRHMDLVLDTDIGTVPKLHFSAKSIDQQPTTNFLPVSVSPTHVPYFNEAVYYDHLSSKRLGRVVLFVPICSSTMDIAQSLAAGMPNDDAVVVVARCQTKGKGRDGNQWLSPAGCAMFSFNLRISLNSKLGQAAGFIPHLLSMSVIHGICSMPEMKEFPLKLKWPNDIYYNRSYKLGGVLAYSSVFGSDMVCTLGCGVNVSNSSPTVCLNDLLPENCNISLSVEQVIAITLSTFEGFVKLFEQGGCDAILPIYYNYWLHTGEVVLLADRQENVQIQGLDQQGYLEVRSQMMGEVFSIYPDGNTFEMMKNLIRTKVQCGLLD